MQVNRIQNSPNFKGVFQIKMEDNKSYNTPQKLQASLNSAVSASGNEQESLLIYSRKNSKDTFYISTPVENTWGDNYLMIKLKQRNIEYAHNSNSEELETNAEQLESYFA